MKIVTQRGKVITGEYFKHKMGSLLSTAVEGVGLMESTEPQMNSSSNPSTLRNQAETAVREMGLDPNSKEGQAAAGAALIANTIAQAIRQYEAKTGKPAPRHVVLALQSRFLKMLNPQGVEEEDEASISQALQHELGHRSSVTSTPKRGEIRAIHSDLKNKPSEES